MRARLIITVYIPLSHNKKKKAKTFTGRLSNWIEFFGKKIKKSAPMNGRSLKKGRNNNCARIVFFQSRFTFLPPKILSTFLWKGKKEEKNIKMELRNLIKIYFSSCYSSKDFIPFFHVLHKDQLGRFIQIWKVGLLSEKCLVWCWELLVARLRPRFRRLLLKKEKKKKGRASWFGLVFQQTAQVTSLLLLFWGHSMIYDFLQNKN